MSAKTDGNIRAFMNVIGALREGAPVEGVKRMQAQVERMNAKHARAVQRDISTMTQEQIRDAQIRQCFLEDTKRGERKGGGTGASRANEAKKLKVTKWDQKHRRRYS
jgi:hypothetical protein